MTRSIHFTALALAATALLATTATAQTQFVKVQKTVPYVEPSVIPPMSLPKFGFQSYNLSGIGERVTYVQCHGLAKNLGLEPGDTIVAMNGFPLTYHGAWNDALSSAMMQGGSVQLAIRDVRSGYIVYRSTFLGGMPVPGPITPKVHHHTAKHFVQPQPMPIGQPGPITPKSLKNKNNNLSAGGKLKVNSQSIEQLGQLLKIGG